ncbi:heptosyltransferase [Sulfuriferula plumbiphila]|uniref:Heptosyltransferase n=1 Tax=Sulfuriferula plumbiphila TaxID=171865 RepID=A0A512LAL7_9PROT|nr:glycosyltransferase family 9 protein [Sulfuriferula plumbiphila]BBP03671.1 heptosyltransferase [Sulfuriferula plumbiphila]GEP31181.1 heptosyltransferase [Sulfuriferula plumbiphila]
MLATPVNLPADSSIQRILVIKWSALGDLVMASALFEDIRRAFPRAEIHLNTQPANQKLFAADTRFAKIIALDTRARSGRLGAMLRWLRSIRAGRYDLVVDLQTSDRSRFLLGVLQLTGMGIRHRVGNHGFWPYTIGPDDLPLDINPVLRMRAALKLAGIPTPTSHPVLAVPEHNRERVQRLLTQHGIADEDYALLFPGCHPRGYLKRWGEQNYAELGRLLLQERLVRHIVIAGGPDEVGLGNTLASHIGTAAVNLCGATEMLDIIPLAEHARYIIGNDTGTSHLAACSARPQVVICGPTDPTRVKPLGDQVIAIQADLPCSNCYRKHCAHHSCMREVRPAQVLALLTVAQVHAIIRVPARILEALPHA